MNQSHRAWQFCSSFIIAAIVIAGLLQSSVRVIADDREREQLEEAKQAFRNSRENPVERVKAARILYPLIRPGMSQSDALALLGGPDRFPKRDSHSRFLVYLMGDQQRIEIELDRQRQLVVQKREIGLGIDPPRFPVPAIPDAMKPYLADYPIAASKMSEGTTLRAGFFPDKAEVVWGEPLTVTLSIANIGDEDFEFTFGGDYRGIGRHNRIKIKMVDANGQELADPRERAMEFGGISATELIAPRGADFTHTIDLTQFRVIAGPGSYKLNCTFDLDSGRGQLQIAIRSEFPFTILPRTPKRVAAVLDQLHAKLESTPEAQLAETMAAIARFGREDSAPRLAKYAHEGPVARRVAALSALSIQAGDPELEIALTAAADADPTIRIAAYDALGRIGKERGIDLLLSALKQEESPVKDSILVSLGLSKSARGREALAVAMEDPSPAIRFAAISGLRQCGDDQAITVLRQYVASPDLAFRYRVVKTLAEELRTPLNTDWLMPILMCRRHNSREWLDSLSAVRIWGGKQAVPVLLSCLDYDVPWSHRNFWILHNVKYAAGAPEFDYLYDPNSTGTAEQHAQNRRTLEKLRPLSGPIGASTVWITTVPTLEVNPPVDFTPIVTEPAPGETLATIRCGFFKLTQNRNGGSESFEPTDEYRPIYQMAEKVQAILNSPEVANESGLSEQQLKDLRQLSMPGRSLVVKEGLVLLYIWWQESPAGPLRQRARDELGECVRAAVQQYHVDHANYATAARKIMDGR